MATSLQPKSMRYRLLATHVLLICFIVDYVSALNGHWDFTASRKPCDWRYYRVKFRGNTGNLP